MNKEEIIKQAIREVLSEDDKLILSDEMAGEIEFDEGDDTTQLEDDINVILEDLADGAASRGDFSRLLEQAKRRAKNVIDQFIEQQK